MPKKEKVTIVKPDNIDDTQLKELTEAFEIFDADNSGAISVKELGAVIRGFGENLADSDVAQIFKDLGKSENEELGINEFLSVMALRPTFSNDLESELRFAFSLFDQNGNGKIPAAELTYAMTNLGNRLKEDEIKEMITIVDRDSNGMIDLNEFLNSFLFKNTN